METAYKYFEDPKFIEKQQELLDLKKKLASAKDSFSNLQQFDMSSFDTSFENKDFGLGKSKDYMNPMTANNQPDFSKGMDFMNLSTGAETNEVANEKGNGGFTKHLSFLGQKGDNALGSLMNAGMQGFTMQSTTAGSEGQSITDGLNMTMKGAQAGMAVGGPIGAGIGAGAGLVYSVIDGFSDANKRGKQTREENKRIFNENRARREQEQRIEEGQQALERLTAVRKQQLGYMI